MALGEIGGCFGKQQRQGSRRRPRLEFSGVCRLWRRGICTRLDCPYLHREYVAPKIWRDCYPKGWRLTNAIQQPPVFGDVSPAAADRGGMTAEGACAFLKKKNTVSNVTRELPPASKGREGEGGPLRAKGRGEEGRVTAATTPGPGLSVGEFRTAGLPFPWEVVKKTSVGDFFSHVATLAGHHKKDVTGMAIPFGSSLLWTGSLDQKVCLWDCKTAQCVRTFDMAGVVNSLISKGPWVFVGIPYKIEAYNTVENNGFSISVHLGQVESMEFCNGSTLFAGTQPGTIMVWRFNAMADGFHFAAALNGHQMAVVSLESGSNNKLFSCSLDHTIRVWNSESFQCLQKLSNHLAVVTSILDSGYFLFSCSFDRSIKVWVPINENGEYKEVYSYKDSEEQSWFKLQGMYDCNGKAVLIASRIDGVICLFELPSFLERGRIFSSKNGLGTIHVSPQASGFFFTNDGDGNVKVWRCMEALAP